MKSDRGGKARGRPTKGGPAPRKPRRTDQGPTFRGSSKSAERRDFGPPSDPYRPAKRPARNADVAGRDEARAPSRPYGSFPPRGGSAPRTPGRGFTVTLDPDVARVFRGDASVNRALRLVLQLTQVVQGPPRPVERPMRGGYQGSPQARGFTRRPRFEDDGDSPPELEE